MSPERYEKWETNDSSLGRANGQETREGEYEDYVPNQNEQLSGGTPAFLLDVPVLNVDEIDLEVDELRAHISLRAELASFVRINVGVDAFVENLKLNIKGVEAQALLKVNLDRVLGTLNRALEAIDKNPQILNEIVRDVDSTVEGLGLGVDREAGQSGESVDRATQPAKGSADHEATSQAGDESGNVTEPAPSESEEVKDEEATTSTLDGLQIEEEYVDEQGRIVGRARDQSGNVVEGVLDDEGNVTDPSVPEDEEDREREDDAEVDATDAARRKASELGVKLTRVRGTGSGGRVLVKDVERATE